MDWFAVVSLGTYPTPTPTAAQRAYQAVMYGLWSGWALPGTISGGKYGSIFMDMSLLA